MKQKQLLFACLFMYAANAGAQGCNLQPPPDVRDIIKLNLFSLPLKNVSAQYEYVLSQKVSLALGGRIMPTMAIPFDGLLNKAFANGNANTKDLVNTSRLGNVAITPEVRYYFGKGYGRGFYAASYYRFAHFSSNTLVLNYAEAGGPKRSVNLNGELTAHSAGLLFGAQWFLGKSITLDWWIAGAHYGASRGRFSGMPSTDFSEGEQIEVKKVLDDLDLPMVRKTVSTSAKNVEVKTNGPFGGVRSGLCLGIRF